jgi:hypothetical protein
VTKFTARNSTLALVVLLFTGVAAKTISAQSLIPNNTKAIKILAGAPADPLAGDPGGGDPEPPPGSSGHAVAIHMQ